MPTVRETRRRSGCRSKHKEAPARTGPSPHYHPDSYGWSSRVWSVRSLRPPQGSRGGFDGAGASRGPCRRSSRAWTRRNQDARPSRSSPQTPSTKVSRESKPIKKSTSCSGTWTRWKRRRRARASRLNRRTRRSRRDPRNVEGRCSCESEARGTAAGEDRQTGRKIHVEPFVRANDGKRCQLRNDGRSQAGRGQLRLQGQDVLLLLLRLQGHLRSEPGPVREVNHSAALVGKDLSSFGPCRSPWPLPCGPGSPGAARSSRSSS